MTLYQILKSWNEHRPEEQQIEFTAEDISNINADTTDFTFNENNQQACSYINHTYGTRYRYDFTFIADADPATRFFAIPNIYEYESGKFSIYFELYKLDENYDSTRITGTLYTVVNGEPELTRENFEDSTAYPRYDNVTVQYAGYNDRFSGNYTVRSIFTNFNIPIFYSRGKVVDYYRNGDDSGLLNIGATKKKFEYFIKNTVYKNGHLYYYRDYRFVTNGYTDPHKMYLVKNENGLGYDYILNGYDNAVIIKKLQRQRSDSANEYSEVQSVEREYLKNSQTATNGNEYTVSFWRTNIHCFDNQTDADDYENTGNTENSTNNKEVNRANDTIVDGHIGQIVSQTDNGTSGISFAYGGQIYALSSVNLASFFTNVLFSTDTDVKDAILEGTQLFGANQINAINGCMYLPISDISDIASVSPVNKCFIGTYEAPITAQRVVANDKMIDCGSAVFDATYDDVRDYEPYCKLYVMLPYCGTHELTISKYINKTVSLKYAVDVTTGACTAYLYANGVIMDSFDGTMGVQRPLTAVNQQEHVSSIINGVVGTATSVAKTVGTAGATMAGGAALSSATTGTAALNATGQIVGASSDFGGGVHGTILQGYNTLQAAIDAPMSTRGAFSGILGQFGNQFPYFIFAWLKTSKPANEIETVGLPSNAGGVVGSFGGFLQCSAFNLANGFGGTDAEAAEIASLMASGVYVS